MHTPTIKIIGNIRPSHINDYKFGKRYMIEGGTLARGWEPGDSGEGWCEFIIYDGDTYCSSYCGEVWPEAWPEYFTVKSNGTAHPTQKCWDLISKAAV